MISTKRIFMVEKDRVLSLSFSQSFSSKNSSKSAVVKEVSEKFEEAKAEKKKWQAKFERAKHNFEQAEKIFATMEVALKDAMADQMKEMGVEGTPIFIFDHSFLDIFINYLSRAKTRKGASVQHLLGRLQRR